MLNISTNRINKDFDQNKYASIRHVNSLLSSQRFKRILLSIFGASSIFLFLPWTQNIQAEGELTTIQPNQRPQTIHSVISGRIEKWFVKEGDTVKKGDTILHISDINDQFFDPQLIERTDNQIKAKEFTVDAYQAKAKAIDSQIYALRQTLDLKLRQAKNSLKQAELKLKSDSIDFKAANINFTVAKSQFDRLQKLYEKGLKSLTEVENRKNRFQEAQAKLISAENKLLSSRNQLLNAQIELTSIGAQYRDDIAKAESEKFQALSKFYDSKIQLTKLKNSFTNFSVRRGMYYITAPQNGYITKAIQAGIGETVKEGSPIISIMPKDYDLAVELFVNPIDLPLIEKGQEVRIQFDGWPAIIFSGWPNTSYGTYGGKVYAIDNFISKNGKFRVLVKQDLQDHEWPKALRVGGGTRNMLLLKRVPIWYELWRKINGFPPDFYRTTANSENGKNEKM